MCRMLGTPALFVVPLFLFLFVLEVVVSFSVFCREFSFSRRCGVSWWAAVVDAFRVSRF